MKYLFERSGMRFLSSAVIPGKAVAMKKSASGTMKRLVLVLAGLAALGGCAVVPYNAGYYDQPAYGGSVVYAAPPAVYVAPTVNFGFQYRSHRGYYGPRHYGPRHHGRRGWR